MNRLLCWLLTATFSISSSSLCAAVFERDWHTPGDGLLTYDDVNRREWLDLFVSRIDQFPQPWLANAVAEIGPGGLFEGFRWAKRNDLISFAESAGIDTTTFEASVNGTHVTELIALIEPTTESIIGIRSVGFINETDNIGRPVGADLLADKRFGTGQILAAGLFISSFNDLLPLGSTGLMLYRVVPEPSATCLLIFSVFVVRRLRPSC